MNSKYAFVLPVLLQVLTGILQRSNYTEPSTSFLSQDDDGKSAKGRARQTISDKRHVNEGKKKKSSMNIRTALLYRKNLATLIDESVSLSKLAGVAAH